MRVRVPAWPLIVFVLLARSLAAQAESGPVVHVEFTNPALTPAHWELTVNSDGSGHFHSEPGSPPPAPPQGTVQLTEPAIDPPALDREIQLSPAFAKRLFQTARRHNRFSQECDSHMKVAFQGWKKLSYAGPEGEGSCLFNYSKDKEIQALGDSLVAVAGTILAGARIEKLLQYDRLGLDRELEYLTEAVKDGRVQQIGVIRATLERLVADPAIMDRVRKRARLLLARHEE